MALSRNHIISAAIGAGFFLAARTGLRKWRAFDFAGKNVLITGGSRGLGLELARRFAKEGANLILCARDQEELELAAEQIRRHGASVWTFVCDVTDERSVESTVREIQNKCGSVDVLVNNAGIIQCGPMETMTPYDYEEAMRTHLFGPVHFVQALLPEMRRRGRGRIVNIASIGGLISVPHLLPYSASKFALVGYSLGLRSELAKDGITVTTVCPGLMRTGSARNAFFKGQHRKEYALFKISDSLPIASMSAERAARKIVEACRQGDSFTVLGLPAKVAAILAAHAPGLIAGAFGFVNRWLPREGGIGTQRLRGFESESRMSESWLTAMTDAAAARNNELTMSSQGR